MRSLEYRWLDPHQYSDMDRFIPRPGDLPFRIELQSFCQFVLAAFLKQKTIKLRHRPQDQCLEPYDAPS